MDVLESKGVEAMMKHGEWKSEASAAAYATEDEITTQRLRVACKAMIDLSDDDA